LLPVLPAWPDRSIGAAISAADLAGERKSALVRHGVVTCLAAMIDDSTIARGAIADLVHGYALAIRRGEASRCPEMFTANGTFEVREGDPRDPASVRRLSLAEGRDALGRYLAASTSQVRMLPMIHNLIVELDGDRATASSLMVGRVWPDGGEVIGEYADCFDCKGGRWRFASRVYTIYRATPSAA
jgi:hypothetical protein